ncbi:MAG: hypothetical protein IJ778_00820 [Alphaproteobacteria bacterium]|nr:hypothetical protein [Alphaproteobacteria bacterium]
MKKLCLIALLSLACSAQNKVLAAENLFGDEEDSVLAQQVADVPVETNSATISSFLSTRIPESAAININKAEKVFCYTVDYAPADYSGYMIDGLAVKGSCGELSENGKQLIKESLIQNSAAFSTSIDNCQIVPKIMLRYIYGPDHTDVLLSAPCYSLTFFHGRDIMTINAAPGAKIMEKIVDAYDKLEEKYLSPALLNQMIANGQITTQSQKEIVRKLSPTEAPVKKWQKETPQKDASQAKQPSLKGWNKIR